METFRAGIGGMRHLATELGKVDQACGQIKKLSSEEVDEVLQFIGELVAKRASEQKENRKGTSDALLTHLNKWSFNEGEQEELTMHVTQIREGRAF